METCRSGEFWGGVNTHQDVYIINFILIKDYFHNSRHFLLDFLILFA